MKLRDVEQSKFQHAYVCTGKTSFALSDIKKKNQYSECEVTELHLIQKCVYIVIGGEKS